MSLSYYQLGPSTHITYTTHVCVCAHAHTHTHTHICLGIIDGLYKKQAIEQTKNMCISPLMLIHFLCGPFPNLAPMLRYNLLQSPQFTDVAIVLVITLYYSCFYVYFLHQTVSIILLYYYY